MTCIAGLEHAGGITIGGDTAGVAGHDLTIRRDGKVFRNGPYMIGFTTSFRMGQVLRYRFVPPPLPPRRLDRFMAVDFVDAVQTALHSAGWLLSEKGRMTGGEFLVGAAGRLYAVHSDFQIARAASAYNAVGSGGRVALGALHATARAGMSPRQRVRAALSAAAALDAAVAPPFHIRTLAAA